MIEKYARVLHFPIKLQPLLRLNRHFYAETVQQIKIVRGCKADARRTFQTITIFAPNVQPLRQGLIEFLDRKQPRRSICIGCSGVGFGI